MLFWGSFVSPVQEMSVEPVIAPVEYVLAPAAVNGMTAETEKTLIEDHAAPNWNLSAEDAWAKYFNHEIILEEIVPNVEYKIHHAGGVMDVLIENF